VAVSRTLNIERLNQGQPLIAAAPDSWDDAFTLNPTIVRLERSPRNDELIQGLLSPEALDDPKLSDGVVAIFYRGIPRDVPGCPPFRSAVGLAVFTPDLQLLKRFAHPLVLPTDDPEGYDYSGVEDQRITRIGDTFYMVYCGFNANLSMEKRVSICLAESADLLNWTKLGPALGNVNDHPNKDAVIMPEPINGSYMMLHRPMVGDQGEFNISLATSDSPTGEWRDLGTIMRAEQDPRYMISWLGAGSAPLPLGNNRYLADYHTGNFSAAGDRDYCAGYAILNFNRFNLDSLPDIVEARCDNLLEPETPYEVNSPWPQTTKLNCVFPAGSFEYHDDVILVYGGADAYVLGARINKRELLAYLEGLGAGAGSDPAQPK
jgi:beta-1,2-mannobiose phosphorylase / 1,2-beta-oligomannan phosphorylase